MTHFALAPLAGALPEMGRVGWEGDDMTMKQRILEGTKAAYEYDDRQWNQAGPRFRRKFIDQFTAGLIAGGFIPAPKVKGKRKAGVKL